MAQIGEPKRRVGPGRIEHSTNPHTPGSRIAMRRFLRTLTLLSLPWFVLGAIWIVSSKQKPDNGQDNEPATKVQPGVMNEKQKEHSKPYDKNYTKGHGRLDEDQQSKRVQDFQSNMNKP